MDETGSDKDENVGQTSSEQKMTGPKFDSGARDQKDSKAVSLQRRRSLRKQILKRKASKVEQRENGLKEISQLKSEPEVIREKLENNEGRKSLATPAKIGSSSLRRTSSPSSPSASQSSSSVVVDVRPRQSSRHAFTASAAVKHEAHVLSRVSQLKQEGLWSSKPLQKIQEPSVPRAHWSFLLEEMTWVSSLIHSEMKAKKTMARKCAKLVQKYFQDKANAEIRAEKQDELNRRKVASFIAREVRTFWSNVNKVFEFKIKSQLEQRRKQALDEHLNMIVDRTEKYSSLLAESLATNAKSNSLKTTPNVSDEESVSSFGGNASSKNDREYEPDMSSDDDERTIGKDDDVNEEGEINMLEQEAEIPIEELLKKFHPELYEQTNESTEEPSIQEEGKESASKEDERVKQNLNKPGKKEIPEKKGNEDQDNLKSLVEEDPELFDAVETAEAFQPTGNTLDTTTVKTPVPFLLKHTLREYQHIGLDWLVSLHDRSFNGILADEMGLGKTIQTIALLAHLACSKGIWGPHLIVVPTSVMLNWEMEIKKWCPGFKVLTYYGSQKERRMKRVGWTKKNSFHVCITSYKLVIQDHQSFRRKQWYYFILDEAQHIKNFKSQRWQLLLNFSTQGRLLLTGTPLQNNLMELWSLMHFLMPNVFQSHKNFKEWFSNPLTGMVEDSQEYNEGLVRRLHKVLRPFLLRRLKNEVEKQLPKKYEHVVACSLSKRQRFLYDDFMSRAKTKETLSGGNFMSVINCLMQLRKVCNHPNLFEPRPILSPFIPESFDVLDSIPDQLFSILDHNPLDKIDINHYNHPLNLLSHEFFLSAYGAFESRFLQNKFSRAVDILASYEPSVSAPKNRFRMTIRYNNNPPVNNNEFIPISTIVNNKIWIKKKNDLNVKTNKGTFLLTAVQHQKSPSDLERFLLSQSGKENGTDEAVIMEKKLESPLKRKRKLSSSLLKEKSISDDENEAKELKKPRYLEAKGIFSSQVFKKLKLIPSTLKKDSQESMKTSIDSLVRINDFKLRGSPLYGNDFVSALSFIKDKVDMKELENLFDRESYYNSGDMTTVMLGLFKCHMKLNLNEKNFLKRFHLYVPSVIGSLKSSRLEVKPHLRVEFTRRFREVQKLSPIEFNLLLPETRLIQYDCGKLQTLGRLLHQLKTGGHRVLLFTQMTKVLDILEAFLNYQGYTYLRLDGSTKIEQRQVLMERFNNSSRYFCFILSTRSGGVGINLTGADTVIFYDSDWNPTMDAQAQDRCHRIGQTRDVHIYRLVSQRTVEENILKKANQKRLLGDLAIDGGNFNTAHLKAQTIKELFNLEGGSTSDEPSNEPNEDAQIVDKRSLGAFESAIAAVEDTTDTEAMMRAKREALAEEEEFDEDADKANTNEDDGFSQVVRQLTPVERYALAQIEFNEKDRENEQILAAEAEWAAQRKQLEEAHKQEMEEFEAAIAAEQVTDSDDDSDENADDSDENADDSDEDEEEQEDDEDEGKESVESDSLPQMRSSPRTRSKVDVDINLWNLKNA